MMKCFYIFPGGIGGGRKFFGNSRGVGGLPLLPQNGKSEGVGGPIWNSLRGGGMDIFWNYTISSNVIIWFANLPFDKKTDNAAHVSVLCDAFISSQTWMILTERIVLFGVVCTLTDITVVKICHQLTPLHPCVHRILTTKMIIIFNKSTHHAKPLLLCWNPSLRSKTPKIILSQITQTGRDLISFGPPELTQKSSSYRSDQEI